jgi:hypothetical protein
MARTASSVGRGYRLTGSPRHPDLGFLVVMRPL